jgi:soluble lytic murein transglycosylase-like protein
VIWLVCAGALASDGLDRVASLVRQGDDAAALKAIEALPEDIRDTDRVRYLWGRLLLAVGRPCDAMDALASTPSTLPESMRTDAMRRWARAAARCGECQKARPALLTVASLDAQATRRDRALAAHCAMQIGETEVAAEELARLTSARHGVANRVVLLALLSDLYVQLDRPDEAQHAALEAWISAVDPLEEEIALRLEDRAAPTVSDRIGHAQALVDARRFNEAVDELEAIDVGGDEELRQRWHHVYGMALFRTRARYLDAARVLYESSMLGGPYEIEDAFHSARALSRADKDARAVRAYRRFAARYPKSKRAPQALFLAAWLEIRLGRSNGEKQMERLVTGKNQLHGRWRRSALWELGFRAVETRRYSRAARFLSQYTGLATISMDQARGLYWLGRAYRRGDKAVEAYRKAIAVEPLHWYAVLAAQRLHQLKVEPPGPFENASSPSSVEVPSTPAPLPETFLVYRSLGLDRDGIGWMATHEVELVAAYPQAQRIVVLAHLYRDAGGYREALRTVRRRGAFLHSDPEVHRWWWDAAYPMPWLEAVDAHRGELPRALVYATMRQESGFRPHVISRAGAVGLMQVMPELATKMTGETVTRRALQVPEKNIELGLREMNALAEHFDRVYPLSIASYNAGKSRVRRWLAESGRMELDRFVERIPFNETRNYVRRVSTHYARYAYLDDPDSGWPALPRFVKP